MAAVKKIILGVTGSIAAHKAADLASLLTKAKCDVRVVMTADAQHFITALPFKTLTRNPVVTNLYDEEEGWQPTHIRLADEADLLLIAPATANVIAKIANGFADDALTCIALALNPKAKILTGPGDERQDVAARGDAGERENVESARRRIHRAGRRDAVLRLRRRGPALAGGTGCGTRVETAALILPKRIYESKPCPVAEAAARAV